MKYYIAMRKTNADVYVIGLEYKVVQCKHMMQCNLIDRRDCSREGIELRGIFCVGGFGKRASKICVSRGNIECHSCWWGVIEVDEEEILPWILRGK